MTPPRRAAANWEYLAQRRKDAKFGKKITFLKRIHFRFSDLCALASLREVFRLSIAALAR